MIPRREMLRVLALVCAGLLLGATADEQTEVARRAISDANNAFSLNLYQALRSQAGNFVVSPLSVGALLSLVYLGSGGNTAAQLKAALHLPDDHAQVSSGFKALIEASRMSSNTTSRIANKLYLSYDLDLKPNFKQSSVDSFGSDAEKVNFNDNATRVAINDWVEQQTDRKIKDLFEPGELGSDTVMVLVNAIYFKGKWRHQFLQSSTRLDTFHLAANSEIPVPFMYQKKYHNFFRIPSLNTRVLELMYTGNEFKFWVFLPDAVDGLDALEAGLGEIDFREISQNLSLTSVELYLPRFKIENKYYLQNTLQQLGVVDIFSDSANFSGISDSPMKVSKVIQKAFIQVEETGTIAAAATGIEMVLTSLDVSRPEIFRADHPFLYALLDSANTIWFIGRVRSPA